MFRTAFACVLIPAALVLVLAGLRTPQPQDAASVTVPLDEPLIVRAVKTDRYRAPLVEPVAFVASAPVVEVRPQAAVPVVAALPPRQAKIVPARLDLCARHGLQKVNYTKPNGWKYWRCQR